MTLFIFDLDDTLVKLNPEYTKIMYAAFHDGYLHHHPELSREEAVARANHAYHTQGHATLCDKSRVTPGVYLETAYDIFLKNANLSKILPPCEKTQTAVKALAELGELAILSHSHSKYIHAVLQAMGIDKYFDKTHIFGLDTVGCSTENMKHTSDIVARVAQKLGYDISDAVFLEDSKSSLTRPFEAGAHTVFITGGTLTHEPHENAELPYGAKESYNHVAEFAKAYCDRNIA